MEGVRTGSKGVWKCVGSKLAAWRPKKVNGPWEWTSKLRLEGKRNEAFGKEWCCCVRVRAEERRRVPQAWP